MSSEVLVPACEVDQFKTTVTDVFGELLDARVKQGRKPVFVTGFERTDQDVIDARAIIGREEDTGEGVDYIYHEFRDPEERRSQKHYYYGQYGWEPAGRLLAVSDLFETVVSAAVEQEWLSPEANDTIQAATDRLAATVREYRESVSLADIAALFEARAVDQLQTLLGGVGEDQRVVWMLLFGKDPSGDTVPNETITTPFISETGQLMIVRAERQYEGDTYPYGAVIGYDDTPERFFVHRIRNDADLKDPDTDWTLDMVKEKMGFDAHIWEVGGSLPTGDVVRVQGDLAVRRRSYEAGVSEAVSAAVQDREQELLREHFDSETTFRDHSQVRLRWGDVTVTAEDTEALKTLQEEVGIDEETVRGRQEERGWQRLTANRRQQIVEAILYEQAVEEACVASGTTPEAVRTAQRNEVEAAFAETKEQVNNVFGNHMVILSGAASHPFERDVATDETQGLFVVPDEAQLLIHHGEHNDVQRTIDSGIYEFRFLDGFETEWWMNQ